MTVVISGGPGSGKTHLARQFVWTHRDHYPGGIFWVDSKTDMERCKCFWDIAQAATLLSDSKELSNPDSRTSHEYIDAVRDWLQTRDNWLLVFDGVSLTEDEDLDQFRKFLPYKENCNIIYTSVDKTLRKRERLYEPSEIRVHSLGVNEACKLLFKNLSIRKPTTEQMHKATEIVQYYECLPLAIHAVSHRLEATSKPIEKYQIGSNLTEKKLAEPFLDIMHVLFTTQHYEALNLINILSFLGHQVPVGLILLGKASLETWNVNIMTSSRGISNGDIDTTLGTLIRYGLISRTTTSYAQYPAGSSMRSGDDSGDGKANTPELSESQTESSQEAFFPTGPGERTIDVIKIHSVVQGFCRDELKIMDEELKQMDSNNPYAVCYDSWLVVATRLLFKSYDAAKAKMDNGHALVKDYREYETQASKLIEHYPKKIHLATRMVREDRDELKRMLRDIASAIDRISPGSSNESVGQKQSIFDRSGSSSSSVPASSIEESPAKELTWNWRDIVTTQSDSPDEVMEPNLKPFPPSIYREPSFGKDAGYETDVEGKGVVRVSPALSQGSQATERPKSSSESSPPQDEGEWHLLEKPQKPSLKLPGGQFKKPQIKFRPDPQEPTLASPMLNLQQAAGKAASSEMSNMRRSSSSSEAERALNAMHISSPSSSENTKPSSQGKGKENAPTYAHGAAARLQAQEAKGWHRSVSMPGTRTLSAGLQNKSSGESLDSKVNKSHLSTELKPGMGGSTHSEIHHGLVPQLNTSIADARTAPGTRYHSRNPSALPCEAATEMAASVPNLVPYYPQPVPYEEDITITHAHRRLGSSPMAVPVSQPMATSPPIAHPSAFMPGSSPPHSAPAEGFKGRSSAGTPEQMSRGPSGESHPFLSTDFVSQTQRLQSSSPVQEPPSLSALADEHHNVATGGWVDDGNTFQVTTGTGGQAYPGPGHLSNTRLGNAHYRLASDPAQSAQHSDHQGDVRAARDRLIGYGRQPVPRAYGTYQRNRSEVSLVAPSQDMPGPTRRRSGSSPPRPAPPH